MAGVSVDVCAISDQDVDACWIEPGRPEPWRADREAAVPDPDLPDGLAGDAVRVARRALAARVGAAIPSADPDGGGTVPAPQGPPAADAEAPDPPNLAPLGSSYPQGSGQSLRAISVGSAYQRVDSEGGAAFQLSIGILPPGTEIGGVEIGVEAIASGALADGSFDGGTAGAHGWLSPGRFNIALYVVGGGVADQSPPEHGGVNHVLQGSAGVEYVIGRDPDLPRMTIGGAVQAGVQDRAQIGEADASTYLANATTVGGIINANLTLWYGAPGSPSARIPRLDVWGEISASHTGGDTTTAPPATPGDPPVVRPTGESSSASATTGITVNLPLTASGLHVISGGVFGGVHPQRDQVGGATASSTQLVFGAGLGYAGRF